MQIKIFRLMTIIILSSLALSMTLSGLKVEKGTSKLTDKIDSNFSFTLKNGTIKTITDYLDKPLVLEWGASWCPLCETNLGVIDEIQDDYKPFVNFLSFSYGGSGDNLEDLKTGNYAKYQKINVALDHTNYYKTIGTLTGDIQFVSTDLEIIKEYDYVYLGTDITKKQFLEDINTLVTTDPTYDPEIMTFPPLSSASTSSSTSDIDVPTTPAFNLITVTEIFFIVTFITIQRKKNT